MYAIRSKKKKNYECQLKWILFKKNSCSSQTCILQYYYFIHDCVIVDMENEQLIIVVRPGEGHAAHVIVF